MIARVKVEDAYGGGQLGSKAEFCPMSLGSGRGCGRLRITFNSFTSTFASILCPANGSGRSQDLDFGYVKSFPTQAILIL